MATGFLEDLFTLFNQVPIYEILSQFAASQKERRNNTPYMGHKNSQKQAQSYYANALINHFKKTLFLPDLQLMDEPEKFKEYIESKGLYSERKLYIFIGRLMLLSGLLKDHEDSSVDVIADLIKKKISTPKNRMAVTRK